MRTLILGQNKLQAWTHLVFSSETISNRCIMYTIEVNEIKNTWMLAVNHIGLMLSFCNFN
jgi:hypothetical protein